MAIVSRKRRPLRREIQTFRDDRLYILACDDTYAPQQYFGFFSIPRIQIHVVPTEDGTSAARHVLDRLKNEPYEEGDERWLILDTDHCVQDNHVGSFTNALKEAREEGVRVALSRPCFELWLLLHHLDSELVVDLTDAEAVEQELRRILGGYNKTRLCSTDFPFSSVAEACRRARLLDESTGGGEIPAGPSSRVYQLWQSIFENALPSQLPIGFAG
ncbi:RloB family protein [Frateuria sp. GZRe14]|uniref:RloB family protein n=1 Tax=Frateuria sp. GZRe14 TaxID=3351534 RepID=UPI003EDBEB1E